jgi:hypothetical protein
MQSGRLCKVNARKAGNDGIAARFTLHSYLQAYKLDNQDIRSVWVFQSGRSIIQQGVLRLLGHLHYLLVGI